MKKLHLIPQAKSLVYCSGEFDLNLFSGVFSSFRSKRLQQAIDKLQEDIEPYLKLHKVKSVKPNVIFREEKELGKQAYRLEITPGEIIISGKKAEGCFNGIQTLRQIIRQSGSSLPALTIEDEPDFAVRGFYHDATRGKVPKLETVFELVDKMAFYKMNQLQLYVEHTFAFKNHADLWQGADPFSVDDISRIDQYCYDNFIDFVPSLSCFGHCYTLISSPRKQHLNELDIDASKQPFSWWNRMAHYTLDCQNPESVELMRELITEYAGCFRSKYFNICCDETFDLGKGKNANLAEQAGSGKLYVDFVKKLIEIVHDCGKIPMLWGDILHKYPEKINELPEDAVVLNWDYGIDLKHGDCRPFVNAGRNYYVCPGVNGWNQWLPKINTSRKNISRFAKEGKKHGASGVLNTDWGDWGHVNALSLSMPGICLGAACSWNAGSDSEKGFDKAFSLLEYGEKSAVIVEILAKFAEASKVNWSNTAFSFDKGIPEEWRDARSGLADLVLQQFNDVDFEQTVKKLETLRLQLQEAGKKLVKKDPVSFQEMDCALWGEILQHQTIWLYRQQAGLEPKPRDFDAGKIADEWYRFERTLSVLWHAKNRPSEYYRIKMMIGEIAKKLED